MDLITELLSLSWFHLARDLVAHALVSLPAPLDCGQLKWDGRFLVEESLGVDVSSAPPPSHAVDPWSSSQVSPNPPPLPPSSAADYSNTLP